LFWLFFVCFYFVGVFWGFGGVLGLWLFWWVFVGWYLCGLVNEGLHVYWQDQEVRLSRPTAWSDDALGSMIEAGSIVRHDVAFFRDDPIAFVIMAIKYSRSAFHSGVGIRQQWVEMDNLPARMLWVATLPAGWLVHWLERFGLASVVHRIRLLFA
jgi:hypothetical protein